MRWVRGREEQEKDGKEGQHFFFGGPAWCGSVWMCVQCWLLSFSKQLVNFTNLAK